MDSLLLFRLFLSFVIAGLWIAIATVFAEKLGSKIGGLLTNLPSNILISMIFVAKVNDPAFVVATIPAVPLGMAIDTVFLFVFILALKRGLFFATTVSLLSWFILAVLATSFQTHYLLFNCFIYVIITLAAFFILEHYFHIPAIKKVDKKYYPSQIIIRALFAGGIVAAVILISKLFNPFITGIFSTFPAVLLSTMVILVINQDVSFAKATGKILILSSSNIVVYGIGVYFTYQSLGIFTGTVISFTMSLLWVSGLRKVLNKIS